MVEEDITNILKSNLEDSESEVETGDNFNEEENYACVQRAKKSKLSVVKANSDFIWKDGYVWKQNSKRKNSQKNTIF